MKPKAKNCNEINAKMNEDIGVKTDAGDLEFLADLICLELKDDAKMLYASRRGIMRELRANINMLQSVLNGQDKKRVRNPSVNG
jgi:hypothetical protein